jgi:hypothetical protein
MYRRLHIPEPEKEQRAHRQIKRMADARQREIKLVRFSLQLIILFQIKSYSFWKIVQLFVIFHLLAVVYLTKLVQNYSI